VRVHWHITSVTAAFDPLPSDAMLSMTIQCIEALTPGDYQPPFFERAANEKCAKKFYSHTKTTSRYVKENSENIENIPKRLFGFKRRHSETNDENEENLNALNLKSLQSYNQSSAIANALTPKRNCFNNNSGKG